MTTSSHRLDFVCVGPQRTASSWLDHALRAHPSIALPQFVKETFFFDRRFDRGFTWYRELFGETAAHQRVGEIAPTLFASATACARVREHNPEARIIVLVRNPILRTYSLLQHDFAKGTIGSDFMLAMRQHPDVVDTGRYAKHLPMWYDAFGAEQVLLVEQSDLSSDPQPVMDRICAFLAVPPLAMTAELRQPVGTRLTPRFRTAAAIATKAARMLRAAGLHRAVSFGKSLGLRAVYRGRNSDAVPLTPALFACLAEAHAEDIVYLERVLGGSRGDWIDPVVCGVTSSVQS